MSRAIPHYVKSLDKFLPTKTAYKAHLQHYLQHFPKNKPLEDENLHMDLIDFIQRYCDKKDHLSEKFDLENCYFEIRRSQEGTNCFFIVDKLNTEISEQISIHNFGNLPTALDNFKRLFVYLISDLKEQKRIDECNLLGCSIKDWDLYHINPTTHELVLLFLSEKGISDDVLENIISENNQGNEIPKLTEDYKHLEKGILAFYQEKLNSLNVKLHKRKNTDM